MQLQHLKGFNANLPAGLIADANRPDVYYYAVGATVVCACTSDPRAQRLLNGHDDVVTTLAASPDGGLLATAQRGKNSDVVIWDAEAGVAMYRLQEHDREVAHVSFSPDGRLLLSIGGTEDRRLFLWDTNTGKIVTKAMMPPEYKRTSSVAWSPEVAGSGRYVFATVAEIDVLLWTVDPFKGSVTSESITPGSIRRTVTSLNYSPDAAWLFCTTSTGDVLTVNVARRAVQIMHPVCNSSIGAAVPWPGCSLLVGAADGTICSFDYTASAHDAPPLAQLPSSVTSLTAAADGETVLAGTAGGGVYSYHVASGAITILSESHTAPVQGLSFASCDPSCVLTCSADGTVCLWRLGDFALLARIAEVKQAGVPTSCALGDGFVLSGWTDGFIRCHTLLEDGQSRQQWYIPNAHKTEHNQGIPCLVLSSHQRFALSAGSGGEIRVWDVASRELVGQLKRHTHPINDLQILPGDQQLIAACEDRSWSLWNIDQEKCCGQYTTAMGGVRSVAAVGDQPIVISVGVDPSIFVWDVRGTKAIQSIPGTHNGPMNSCAVSKSGKFLATGGTDGQVKLWELPAGELCGSFAAHAGAVTKLAFSPDDNHLVSCSVDGTMAFWRL